MGLSTVSIFKNLHVHNSDLKKLSNAQLQQLQQVLLEMTVDFDRVCKKHHLHYTLSGGTCLGAIRHNGFIPWDDDIDLNLTRADYKKLCQIFDQELGDKYWLETTTSSHLGFARIRKKGTVYRAREDSGDSNKCGIYIDIFIIDNTFNFTPLRYFHGFLSLLCGFNLSCKNFFINRKLYLSLVQNDRKNRLIFKTKIAIGALFFWLSVGRMVKIWDSVNKMCHNRHSKYVTIPVGRKHFFGELITRTDLCETVPHQFEQYAFPIPKGYNIYLQHLYGNYMYIPKKSEREAHVFLELDFGDSLRNKPTK